MLIYVRHIWEDNSVLNLGAAGKQSLTSLACCALTGSLNCRRAWNWLFLVNVIIFMTVPNLEKICQQNKENINFNIQVIHVTCQWNHLLLYGHNNCCLPVAVHPALQGRTCCRWWSAAQDWRLQRELLVHLSLVTHQTGLPTLPEAQPGSATVKHKMSVTIFNNGAPQTHFTNY